MGRYNDANARTLGNKLGTYMGIDKSDIIGINKSLRIRTLVDLRRPLKPEVTLKMRGGNTASFKVKYEKLPLFCFVCGMLGHGEKDCDSGSHTQNPKRTYSDKLRASPWQVNKGEVDEEGQTGTCARKLFVRKEKPVGSTVTKEKVLDVVEQLKGVTLTVERGESEENGVEEKQQE